MLRAKLLIPRPSRLKIAQVAAGGLQAELNRRLRCIEGPQGGEPFADVQASLVPAARFRAVAEHGQLIFHDLIELAELHDRLGPVVLAGTNRRLRQDPELAHFLAPAGFTARVVANQPAVSVRRQRVRRVTIDHVQKDLAGHCPLADADVVVRHGKRCRRSLVLMHAAEHGCNLCQHTVGVC